MSQSILGHAAFVPHTNAPRTITQPIATFDHGNAMERIAELERENAKLREDKARLDWLTTCPASVYASVDADGNKLSHFVAVPEQDQNSRRGFVRATPREAIDYAMSGKA